MKLNHLNLTVSDVQAASDFLVKYFGMRSMGGNKGMGFLTDEEDGWGFVLTLMKATEGATVQISRHLSHRIFYRGQGDRGRDPSPAQRGWF